MVSAATSAVGVVAHQGGWDELLLIAAPILAIVGLLVVAKRRVDAAADARAAARGSGDHGDGRDGDPEDAARSM